MSIDWNLARAAGWRVVYGVLIEGIPYAFIEQQLPRVDADAMPGTPAGFDATLEALMIGDGMRLSIEADRQKGVASGARWDVVLDWDGLGDIAAELFGAPTRKMLVTGSVTTATQDTIEHRAGDESGWPSSGRAYLDIELLEYDAISSANISGVTRGLCGRPHYHAPIGGGLGHDGFSYLSDRPQAWSGRLVTCFEHLVSPGGHMLADTWCTVGDGCRELWVGQIDGLPVPDVDGWHLGSIPLVRRLALNIGIVAKGIISEPRNRGARYLYVGASDVLSFTVTRDDGGSAVSEVLAAPSGVPAGYIRLDTWATYVADTLRSLDLSPAGYLNPGSPSVITSSVSAGVLIQLNFGTGVGADVLAVSVDPQCSWLEPGNYAMSSLYRDDTVSSWNVWIPWRASPDTATLSITLDEETSAEDAAWVPPSGTLLLEQGSVKELAAYTDGGVSVLAGLDYVLTITHRDLGGSGVRVDLFGPDEVTVTVLAGATGTLKHVFMTLATSTGLGSNGDWDTLALGQGCGIPVDRIEADTLDVWPHDSVPIPAVANEQASLETLVGGWVALYGRCFVQRRGADGVVRIALVQTSPQRTDRLLTSDDVLMDSHEPAKPLQPANEIEIQRGFLGVDRKEIPRDRPRAAIEGAQRWTFAAPGISIADALDVADDFLRAQEGTQALTVGTPIGVLQVGEAVDLRTAHPLVWSYASGQRAPASILGMALTWQRDLGRDQEHALLLLEGLVPPAAYLCPSPVILSVEDDVLTLEPGSGGWFQVGEDVEVYIPGVEQVDATTAEVLPSSFVGSNPYYAGFWDLVVTSEISLTAVQFKPTSTTTGTWDIYTRPGTAAGHEGSATGWTLLQSTSCDTTGNTVFSIPLTSPLVLPAGTYGFYLRKSAGSGFLRYLSGINPTADALVTITPVSRSGSTAFSGSAGSDSIEIGVEYEHGGLADTTVVRTVSAIDGDDVTISAPLPGDGSDYEGVGRVTYPATGDGASSRQLEYTHVDADSEWL